MSLSDHFRSILKKSSPDNKGEKAASAVPPAQASPEPAGATPNPAEEGSQTLEELDRKIAQDRLEGQAKEQLLDRELLGIRTSLEKLELSNATSRETHNQTLHLMQQDAEREIKFFERKLHEDLAQWDKQLKEREKSIAKGAQQAETGREESKAAAEEALTVQKEAVDRTETLLKEQETKLAEERQKWRDLLLFKENELLALKQDLARREADVDKEFKKQELQRKATQDLWQARLKELEHQWAEKRLAWEGAMKAKEEERVRLHATYQEKQASWQLEQERRLQDMTRRHERAQEELSALKAHVTKEMQNWQHLAQNREEQVQQLKVKLLLSETEAKGHLDQTQKVFQESVSQITGRIQTLQRQLQEEQEVWQKQMESKDHELRGLREDIHTKLRRIEAEFTQRLTILNSEKETLQAELGNLQAEYQEANARYTAQTQKLQEEQAALETSHQHRMVEMKKRGEDEISGLQAQIVLFEKQKDQGQKDLEAIRLRWQEEMVAKDQALKEAQTAIAPQETELRKRYAMEEEAVSRQVEAHKTRQRALERDSARLRESIEKLEKDQQSVMQALEIDQRNKEETLKKNAAEQTARLKQRLDERRLALDAFLAMKKDEETRVQNSLRTKEKERLELSTRMETLPQDLERQLQEKKAAVQKESTEIRARIAALEAELNQAREESKTAAQVKATQLAALRQALELKQKEMAASLRSQEQILESERAHIEKQMSASQAEMDRVRAHWQDEIDKKEKDIQALQEELRKQEVTGRQTLEAEQKKLDDQIKPLEQERQSLTDALERQKTEQAQMLAAFEHDKTAGQSQIQLTIAQEREGKAAAETRFRDQRAEWKAQLTALQMQKDQAVCTGQDTFEEKTRSRDQLEDQMRAQGVSYEARRREIVHQATVKSRTLQDIIEQIQHELETTQALLPQQLKERETIIAKLQQDLAATQQSLQRTLGRYDRALKTLERRGHQKQEDLKAAIQISEEDWAKKAAVRDAEIAALQSNLLAQEAERQGELDRLAKQFAEERFQLEKSKDELEWKLKDRKEVSERQLASRQKEILALQTEVRRIQMERDQALTRKTAAFETEKEQLQSALTALQKQMEDARLAQETSLASKEHELQTLLARSKEHLRVLGEEFIQKVGSWRSTNESLREQIEQLKGHAAQAEESWDVHRKEKENDLSALRAELAQWETRIKSELQEFERTFAQERQALVDHVRKEERSLQETIADFERRLAQQEEDMSRAAEEVHSHEAGTEAQWHAALEQWQTEKQSLQQQKTLLEQRLVDMQNSFQAERRQAEDAGAKLRLEIALRETQAAGQVERLQAQRTKELAPLRDRLARLASAEENERGVWEARLRAKEDELKMLKTRLVQREKRLQEEGRRRQQEIDKLRKQVSEETELARARYETERTQLEKLLMDRRESLATLQAREKELFAVEADANSQAAKAVQKEQRLLEENIQHVISQREHLHEHYEVLIREREEEEEMLNQTLIEKERVLEDLRETSKDLAAGLRKKMELLRLTTRQGKQKHGPTSAAGWTAFESGVALYQAQQWEPAARAFEECLQKDPGWGAAYQYLALSYNAQGLASEAAQVAARAKQLDPDNVQLATWVERLQASIQEKKAS